MYTITIDKVELKQGTPFGPRYSWETGEKYTLFLNVTAHDETGLMIYFNTPSIEMRVTAGGGVAIVTYDASNDWVQAGDNYCVGANQSTRNGNAASAKLTVGETITIKGKIKKEYRNAVALNYVKRIS